MGTSVLVVEDDLEINELLGEYLVLEDIRYLQATTGHAGIHLANTQLPDVIILDLMLPDIDGFEVARTLSAHRATYNIPIIILSCMCQDCDKAKGFASGATFFMTKPFLPDVLLAKVREALVWRASLSERVPAGTVKLGCPANDPMPCSRSLNQMVVDLFARTDISDAAIGQIREAMQTLDGWAIQWNAEHAAQSRVTTEYQILPRENGTPGTVEWKMTEDVPGMLTDTFFKQAAVADGGGGVVGAAAGVVSGGLAAAGAVGGAVGGLMGWGSGSVISKTSAVTPIAPPSKWLQVLAKTGAVRFEKDTREKMVRFTRTTTGVSSVPSAGPVPVVEIDGTRYPTRLRDEALAAKRR